MVVWPQTKVYSIIRQPLKLQPYKGDIFGFNNTPVSVKGMIALSIIAGRETRYASICSKFLVVEIYSEYAVVMGRPSLKELRAVVSQPHFCMKFPTTEGVGVVRGN